MKMQVKNSSGRARTEAAVVRLSKEEFEAAKAAARASGLTLSELIRQLLAGHRPRPRRRFEVQGMPEVRRIAALLGHALRSAEPDEQALLEGLYSDACRHFVQLQIVADRAVREDADDGSDNS